MLWPIPADSADGTRYTDKRTELWSLMKDWCNAACLPDDADLAADLSAVEYGYDAGDAILLERKDDMRRRGHPTTAMPWRSPSPIRWRSVILPPAPLGRKHLPAQTMGV